ncbi:sigma-70 family RNA polymerase sigma factor [Psychrobacillus sp.]|uniref:sigma-70 family RNA polymerase sigma factor n=1 Tax=Psychrobacillus sp. TaxID=1871623 RepID=UPI0028BDB195|nr:sigma-70 family RNA polymerase sigma factor [Psychrobacillus sp.]
MEIEDIYRLYVNDLYRYLLSLSKDHYRAEELVQETIYRAFLHIDDYQGYVKPWLFKTGYHVFIDSIRRDQRVVLTDTPLLSSWVAKDLTEETVLEKDGYGKLLTLIEDLPINEKQAILLCDVHDFSYKEASEILVQNINTVKSHLHRGRRKLRKMLQERMEIHES